ncbi:MAG: zinc-binding dehydrogenase [Candidatus Poribacteria bacterium]|nr:zinc-binding dehydrogenase [Candidatus Poribacteria bacterium]
MAATGRAVVATGRRFEIREYPVPEPTPDTLVLRQELAGICGTDIHNWQNGIQGEMLLGHENVGVIEKLGRNVKTDYVGAPVQEGDRVILAPGAKGGAYGFQNNPDNEPRFRGGFADYIHLCLPGTCFIKTTAPPEAAVLIEPFTVGIHAASRSGIEIGDSVVVQGSGAIGLVTLIAAKMRGAGKLIMVGGPKGRLELAKRLGADIVIDIEEVKTAEERREIVMSHTPKRAGADVVFECAGFLPATPEGLSYVRHSGAFIEVGHFVDMGSIEFNPNQMLMRRNLRIEGIWGYRLDDFPRALPIIEKNEIPFADMVSHQLPLERVLDGFKALDGTYRLGGEMVVKIALGAGL